PFGLSILEAALARCALVVGDIPSLQEIWGDAALYVGPDDASALAATLNDLISNADQRELMSGRAAERAKDFSRDRMVQSYLDLYREMLKAPSRRTAHLGDPSQPAGGRTACAS
ncbi:MAG TPA: glycosyltransferase, partial [Tepidisphaeraceae bacterium]|nr:glycosyltransferase [Tepidisphaeraceae bacterium]